MTGPQPQDPSTSRPVPFVAASLTPFLPESLGRWRRTRLGAPARDVRNRVVSMFVSTQAGYAHGTVDLEVSITDMLEIGINLAVDAPAPATVTNEFGPSATTRQGRWLITETVDERGAKSASVYLANGLAVMVQGDDLPTQVQALLQLDLDGIASLRRPVQGSSTFPSGPQR